MTNVASRLGDQWGMILASVGDGVMVVDCRGRVTYLNPAAEELTGWSSADAAGAPSDEVFRLLDERTLHPIASPIEEVLRTGETRQLSNHVVLIRRDGRRMPVEDSAAPLREENGSISGAVLVFHDATARRRSMQRFLLESRAAAVLVDGAGDKNSIYRLLETLGSSLGWEWATLWEPDEKNEQLRAAVIWTAPGISLSGFSEATRRLTPRYGQGFPGRVWADARPECVRNLADSPVYLRREAAAAEGLRTSLAAPIKIEGTVTGIIELVSIHERQVDQELLDALAPVGLQIGLLLQRERAQAEISRREEFKQAILQSALDAMITIDHQGKVLDWNPAAAEMFGYRQEEVLGCDMAQLIVPADLRPRHYHGFQHYLESGEGPLLNRRIEIVAMRKGGDLFPVELAVVPAPTQDGPIFTGYIRDITERQRAEAALKQQARQLAEAAGQKDQFLAMLAHELRNPLAPMRNAVEMLRRKTTQPETVERMSAIIGRHIGHLSRLVDDLLDVSRASRGKIELRLERLDIAGLLHQKTEDFAEAARAAGLTLEADLPDTPVWIRGDTTRIDQIAGNLMTNALKFTPSGGSVNVSLRCEEQDAVITIADTGIGITGDMMPHLFEPFTQGDRSLDRRQGGLGLGLAIARSMAELHQGSIEAQSAGAGAGSRFTVRLPLETGITKKVEQVTAVSEKNTVLLIEDVIDTAETMAELLELEGFQVQVELDGESGLRAALNAPPRFLICDIGLPRLDGFEVAVRLRADPRFANTTMIAISGYGSDEDARKGEAAGFDAYITKPVEFARLLRLLGKEPDEPEP